MRTRTSGSPYAPERRQIARSDIYLRIQRGCARGACADEGRRSSHARPPHEGAGDIEGPAAGRMLAAKARVEAQRPNRQVKPAVHVPRGPRVSAKRCQISNTLRPRAEAGGGPSAFATWPPTRTWEVRVQYEPTNILQIAAEYAPALRLAISVAPARTMQNWQLQSDYKLHASR